MFRNLRLVLLLISVFFLTNNLIFGFSGSDTSKSGLLFYLSGNNGFNADYSVGKGEPNFLNEVKIIKDGAKGPGFECGNLQLFSYWAAGNIYAERGTLSFNWRSRDPLGKTEFPIFRVGYSDHSSWDMVWLRIDYNGNGFDAFVTDANLARVRVSYKIPTIPGPKEWLHFTLAWDETEGIRFYINGKKVAEKDTSCVLFASLDQFGPHSRIISSYQVQSAYTFVRGGDIDEIKIYNHALNDQEINELSKGNSPKSENVNRDLSNAKWAKEWALRFGWNRQGDHPPYLNDKETSVRKVEIHDVYDMGRWWWKANDGIRETTWPGVYNRSRLTGRNDYFQLPDWDCYVSSGKSVRFNMPDEPWNYVEIQGSAFGKMALSDKADGTNATPLFSRQENQERTFHKIEKEEKGKTLVFTNDVIENPIGELNAFDIKPGKAPQGMGTLEYRISNATEEENDNIKGIQNYINGRFTSDERITVLALPQGAPKEPFKNQPKGLPFVHVIIPSDFRSLHREDNSRGGFSYTWQNLNAGLDGIEIEIPALNVKPTAGEFFPMNIQVKDPLWPLRNMFDFSFSVKPNEARTLWLDLRDRILPDDKPLYLTIAASGSDFTAEMLEGAKIKLVFKPWNDAKKENVQDRFTLARDNYDMIIEEHTKDRRLNKYLEFEADMTDLLKLEPNHYPGRNYWYIYNEEQFKPPFIQPTPPQGVPLWAFRQVENLKGYERVVNWFTDKMEVKNNGLGGGLSDDSDLENVWPPLVLMGYEPDKIRKSNQEMMESIYNNGMITKGMQTIQTDGLHQYEEGMNVLGQVNMSDFGNPKNVERLMEMVSAQLNRLIAKNKAGHYHFRSFYFSATKLADEGVWAWSTNQEYLALQPAILLGEYYGHAESRKLVQNMMDGLLAHARKDDKGKIIIDTDINFNTDESRRSPLGTYAAGEKTIRSTGNATAAMHALWAVYNWTGDKKYLQPLLDMKFFTLGVINSNILDELKMRDAWGKQIVSIADAEKENNLAQHFAWQISGDKKYLEDYNGNQMHQNSILEYINTVGSLWTDRVITQERELQRARLGGVALSRGYIYPGLAVSWNFEKPATSESVAIAINSTTPSSVNMEVFNLDHTDVKAELNSWNILPGKWEIVQGVDENGDGKAEIGITTKTVIFERSKPISLVFPSRKSTLISMKLVEEGISYSKRADLAIGNDDVKIDGNKVTVKVHNLGAVSSLATTIALVNSDGKNIAETQIPVIASPIDLTPKTADVVLTIPEGVGSNKLSLLVDPQEKLTEINRTNNSVKLGDK